VQPVLLHVGHIIDDVDGARETAEDGEGRERLPEERGEQVLRKDHRGEDEEILHPLARPQRDEGGVEEAHGLAGC
jgi:hypothetical protein